MINVGPIGRVLMRLGALLLMRPAATITLAAAFMAAAVQPAALGATVAVIEFYNAGSDHYFRTADQDEASAIDQGNAGPGWARTGDDFPAYVTTSAPTGAIDVCRFYGSIVPGPNSHFYTASVAECNALKALALDSTSVHVRTIGCVPR